MDDVTLLHMYIFFVAYITINIPEIWPYRTTITYVLNKHINRDAELFVSEPEYAYGTHLDCGCFKVMWTLFLRRQVYIH